MEIDSKVGVDSAGVDLLEVFRSLSPASLETSFRKRVRQISTNEALSPVQKAKKMQETMLLRSPSGRKMLEQRRKLNASASRFRLETKIDDSEKMATTPKSTHKSRSILDSSDGSHSIARRIVFSTKTHGNDKESSKNKCTADQSINSSSTTFASDDEQTSTVHDVCCSGNNCQQKYKFQPISNENRSSNEFSISKSKAKGSCSAVSPIVSKFPPPTNDELKPSYRSPFPTSQTVEKAQEIEETNLNDIEEDEHTSQSSQTGTGTNKEDTLMTVEGRRPGTDKILGCSHYARGCKLRASCCGKFYTCRFCHDEAEDHEMDRYATSEVLCMRCGTVQSVGPKCVSCGEDFARYFCGVCKFYDDHPTKDIYHCDKCNICRIGKGLGIDYFHCDKCNACMNIALKDKHKCVERSLESNCPICSEYLFTSTLPVMFLPCGHCIHVDCYDQYSKTNYICPICCKSMGDMSHYFSQLDAFIAQQTIPPPYDRKKTLILCNDCEKKSIVPFHFIYHKCGHGECGSYNTRKIQVLDPEPSEEANEQTTENPPSSGETNDTDQQQNDSSNVAAEEGQSVITQAVQLLHQGETEELLVEQGVQEDSSAMEQESTEN